MVAFATRPWFSPSPAVLACAVLLAGCASGGNGSRSAERYPGLSCVPFARALTGVDLHGDAASWWQQAAGRYRRSSVPEEGAILVLDAGGRLPRGHVSVVTRVVDAREIEVVQANWVPDELSRDQPVIDVSDRNDWTLVRVWYPPIAAMGAHPYPALGFILPNAPAHGAALRRTASHAAMRAVAGAS